MQIYKETIYRKGQEAERNYKIGSFPDYDSLISLAQALRDKMNSSPSETPALTSLQLTFTNAEETTIIPRYTKEGDLEVCIRTGLSPIELKTFAQEISLPLPVPSKSVAPESV